ncbi:unnamed protein product [Amoebophrya sp. A25]|nr:unnamed protein product [Amoebophrya sp. A25]|eukprot:GSA25T00004122001.1
MRATVPEDRGGESSLANSDDLPELPPCVEFDNAYTLYSNKASSKRRSTEDAHATSTTASRRTSRTSTSHDGTTLLPLGGGFFKQLYLVRTRSQEQVNDKDTKLVSSRSGARGGGPPAKPRLCDHLRASTVESSTTSRGEMNTLDLKNENAVAKPDQLRLLRIVGQTSSTSTGSSATVESRRKSTTNIKQEPDEQEEFVESKKLLRREVQILSLCFHPGIVRVFETFETDSDFRVVLEYCGGGNLHARVMEQTSTSYNHAENALVPIFLPGKNISTPNKKKMIRESLVAVWMQQLFEAVRYLHAVDICHKSVRAKNVWFTGNDVLKLAGFGLASITDKNNENGNTEEGKQLDMRDLGEVLFFCLHGETTTMVQKSERSKERVLSRPVQELLRALCSPKDEKVSGVRRISAATACAHSWFTVAATGVCDSLDGTVVRQQDEDSTGRRGSTTAERSTTTTKLHASARSTSAENHSASRKESATPLQDPPQPPDTNTSQPLLTGEDVEQLLSRTLETTLDGVRRVSNFLGTTFEDGSKKIAALVEENVPAPSVIVENLDVEKAQTCGICYQELRPPASGAPGTATMMAGFFDSTIKAQPHQPNKASSSSSSSPSTITASATTTPGNYSTSPDSPGVDSSWLDFCCPRCHYVCCRVCFGKLKTPSCPYCKYSDFMVAPLAVAKTVGQVPELRSRLSRGVQDLGQVFCESADWFESEIGAPDLAPPVGVNRQPPLNAAAVATQPRLQVTSSNVRREPAEQPKCEREQQASTGRDSTSSTSSTSRNLVVSGGSLRTAEGQADEDETSRTVVCMWCHRAACSNWDFACPDCFGAICRSCFTQISTRQSSDQDPNLTGFTCPSCRSRERFQFQLKQWAAVVQHSARASAWGRAVADNVKAEVEGADLSGLGKELASSMWEDAKALGSWLLAAPSQESRGGVEEQVNSSSSSASAALQTQARISPQGDGCTTSARGLPTRGRDGLAPADEASCSATSTTNTVFDDDEQP